MSLLTGPQSAYSPSRSQLTIVAAALAGMVHVQCSDSGSAPVVPAVGSGGASSSNSGGSGGGEEVNLGGGGTSTGGGPSTGGAASGGAPGGGSAGVSPGSGGTAVGGAEAAAGAAGSSDFNPCADAAPCVVLPLGDSITWGYPQPETGGYRAPLFARARQGQKKMVLVGSQMDGPDTVDGVAFSKAHEGYGGWTLGQLKERALQQEFKALAPDIILLHGGTNDIENGIDAGQPVPPETVRDSLADLLDQLVVNFPQALIVVAKIIPYKSTTDSQQNAAYNALLEDLVRERAASGQHLLVVDQYQAFVESVDYANNLMADGDHPNSAGYSVMANVWYEAIGPLLP